MTQTYLAGGPAYIDPTQVPNIANESQSEISAQAAGDLAYLALLLKKLHAGSAPAGIQQEIERIIGVLRELAPKSNAFIEEQVEKSLAGLSVPPTAKEIEDYINHWENDGAGSVAVQVSKWLAGDVKGEPPYKFSASTAPSTLFSFIMLMSSFYDSPVANFISDDLNNFFAQGQNGAELPNSTVLAGFLSAYLNANPQIPGGDFISQILPEDKTTGEDRDPFGQFLDVFNGDDPFSYKNGGQDLQGILFFLINYLPSE